MSNKNLKSNRYTISKKGRNSNKHSSCKYKYETHHKLRKVVIFHTYIYWYLVAFTQSTYIIRKCYIWFLYCEGIGKKTYTKKKIKFTCLFFLFILISIEIISKWWYAFRYAKKIAGDLRRRRLLYIWNNLHIILCKLEK